MALSHQNNKREHVRIEEIKQIQNEDDLNVQAKKLHDFFITVSGVAKEFGGLRMPNSPKKKGCNTQKLSAVDQSKKHEIQGLYHRQKHRALQEILFGKYYCSVEQDRVEKYYRSLLSVEQECNISELPPFLWQNTVPAEAANLALNREFTPNEVRRKLLTKINSSLSNSRSVGLDRVKFRDLLENDPNCSILAAFFNACLRLQTVPSIWRLVYSVLIKEGNGDDNELKNWHSITLHNTIPKLFQALIASRLIVWVKSCNRLSATQKGLLLNNAACESSFILQECKKYAQNNNKDLAVAWLDFSNASDTLPVTAVLHALTHHSIPVSIKNIIQSLIKGVQTKIRTMSDDGFTNPIDILKGLPQGSGLNPILLDLVVEPILRNLFAANNDMFQIFNQKINHFAIPNELTLIAESTTKLQNLLNLVEKTAKLIGLQFNISKCSTYHYDSKSNHTEKSIFSFFGEKLDTLPENKINEYFGVKQGLSIGQNGVPTISEMIESIQAVDKSLLDNFQKLEACLTFIIPRVENCLRGLQEINKNFLEETDRFLRSKIISWLNLPDNVSAESIVFHVASSKLIKQAKYLPFLDLLYIMKVVHASNMFASDDKIVKCVAVDSLTTEVSKLVHKKPKNGITMEHLAKYLSGDLHIKNTESNTIWQMVREATLNLKMKIRLVWHCIDDEIQLVIKRSNKKNKLVLSRNYQFDVEEHLKSSLINCYINDIKKRNPECTKSATVTVSTKKGSKNELKKISAKPQPVKVPTVQVPTLFSSNFPVLYVTS